MTNYTDWYLCRDPIPVEWVHPDAWKAAVEYIRQRWGDKVDKSGGIWYGGRYLKARIE